MKEHTPVLLTEVLNLFAPAKGKRMLDVTLGLGGHAAALREQCGDDSFLVGLDADDRNLAKAADLLPKENTLLLHTNFSQLPSCLPKEKREFDIILADLGISSPHLDDPTRGFSFRFDAPLDMRLDQSQGEPATMMIASLDRESLIRIFRDYGEVTQSHRLVDEMIARRRTDPIRTTFALAKATIHSYGQKRGGDILPQVFQALRIAVNGELDALNVLLKEAPKLLAPKGRLAIISFHSLEDRMVKNAFKNLTVPLTDPLTGQDISMPAFELLTKKPLTPSLSEVQHNPRSRSARLRAICRT